MMKLKNVDLIKNIKWLKLFNYLILQFLFLRLYKIVCDGGKVRGYGIMYFVKPLTGWNSSYVFVFGNQKLKTIYDKDNNNSCR